MALDNRALFDLLTMIERACGFGAPEEIRTPDPQIRSLKLSKNPLSILSGQLAYAGQFSCARFLFLNFHAPRNLNSLRLRRTSAVEAFR